MNSCTVSAKPGSDIWRKPPSTNIFNGKSSPPRPPLHTYFPETS